MLNSSYNRQYNNVCVEVEKEDFVFEISDDIFL